jgi:hypothetical protein
MSLPWPSSFPADAHPHPSPPSAPVTSRPADLLWAKGICIHLRCHQHWRREPICQQSRRFTPWRRKGAGGRGRWTSSSRLVEWKVDIDTQKGFCSTVPLALIPLLLWKSHYASPRRQWPKFAASWTPVTQDQEAIRNRSFMRPILTPRLISLIWGKVPAARLFFSVI